MRGSPARRIKFLGTGEKLDALEAFHPQRVASRILEWATSSRCQRAVEHVDREKPKSSPRK